MASFFEKLVGGQSEEKNDKIEKEKKPVLKPKKQIRKPMPRPEPEEEETEELIEAEPEETPEPQKPIKVQAKEESKPKEKKESKELKQEKDFSSEGQLAIDVFQNEEEVVIQSTIGGIKPKDLEITIENGIANIQGSRHKTESIAKENYFIQECHWGSFSRQLVLPSEVDASRAEATLKDGVLTIRMPRIQKEKMTKLEIKG